MTVYTVKVGRVDCEGRFTGYQVIGCVDSKEKVEAKINDYRAKHEINQYWMSYELDENKHIKVYVEELKVE